MELAQYLTLNSIITAAFIITYIVMAVGRLPYTHINRTKAVTVVALLLIFSRTLSLPEVFSAINVPTLTILLALMVISSQFARAGFYTWCANKIAYYQTSPSILLAMIVLIAGLLSALLANDIIAYAMAPILCEGLSKRGLNPKPFLFALMGACNAGSAATMIGNPQNLLIAEHGHLHFWKFVEICGPPALAAMVIVYVTISLVWRRQLKAISSPKKEHFTPQFDNLQTSIGVVFMTALVICFTTALPRAYTAAAIMFLLLIIRFNRAWQMIKYVDWNLIALFAGLFIVNACFTRTGLPSEGVNWLMAHHFHLANLTTLAPFTLVASNAIGNVPAVILTLSQWPIHTHMTLYSLALFITLAGNATITGSLANIIVAERAKRVGTKIAFSEHLRAGLPIALLSIATAWGWLTFTF